MIFKISFNFPMNAWNWFLGSSLSTSETMKEKVYWKVHWSMENQP